MRRISKQYLRFHKRLRRKRYVTPSGRVTDMTVEEATEAMERGNRKLSEKIGPPTKRGPFSW